MMLPFDSATNPSLLVALLGPTGSGKSALALDLAERFKGEIVSCDSVAVYRGMDLGSAKPTSAEQARVRHHLIDIATPDQPYSAGDYSRDARAALREITERGKLPIVTGGTGLYLRALLQGLFPGPARSEELRLRLRKSAVRHGSSWLHRVLARLDPTSSERIHANDEPKLIRSLEVRLTMRQPLSEALAEPGARDPLQGFRILRLGLSPERGALYRRINERAAGMFAAGLVEETRRLLGQYRPPPAALGALGYRQAMQVLAGELGVEEAVAQVQQGHRNYAKRQGTWFRREPEVHWLPGFGDDPAIAQAARLLVTQTLEAASDVRKD